MTLFVPEGFCQTHFASSISGGRVSIFSLGFELLDPTPTDLGLAYDAFVTFGQAIGWPAGVFFEYVRTETGTADPSEPIVETFTGSDVGSGANDLNPPNTSFLFVKNTAQGGRKNRGRMFVPYVQEALTDDAGNLLSATVSNLNDAVAEFRSAVAAALETTDTVLFHSDPADAPTPLTSLVAAGKVATQRRRLRS